METKVIKLKCHQDFVSYKRPGTFELKETYYLPSYSTIIGMVHNACDFTKYHDMKISVQGNNKSKIIDMYTCYEFMPEWKFDKKRHQVKFKYNDKEIGMSKGPKYIELLIEVDLIIHIEVRADLADRVFKALKSPNKFLSLGRHEDLLRIDEVKEVIVKECILNEIENMKYSAYIPIDLFEDQDSDDFALYGTYYTINKKYKIENNYRRWEEKVDVIFGSNVESLLFQDFSVTKDEDGDLVFLA